MPSRWNLLVLVLLLPACAPTVIPAGPAVREAALTEAALVTADDRILALSVWPSTAQERAVIIALHGFNDYRNAFALPAAVWSEQGITTYAFDQRGFGESDMSGLWAGTDTMAADARTAVDLVTQRHPGVPIFLLGDSMGGAVAAVSGLTQPPPGLTGIVLVAPAVWGLDTMPWSYRASLWLVAHVAPGTQLSGSGLDITPSDNIEMLHALGRDPLVIKETRADALLGLVRLMDAGLSAAGETDLPVLIVYGARDEIVPPEPVDHFAGRVDGALTTVVYPESYHMVLRDLGRDLPADEIGRFVIDGGKHFVSDWEIEAGKIVESVDELRNAEADDESLVQ
ncbi:MAG: lysophospholipase [Rhodospirillales bacterium]|nr:lysophospholipase [Rhodospirillales bacterium]